MTRILFSAALATALTATAARAQAPAQTTPRQVPGGAAPRQTTGGNAAVDDRLFTEAAADCGMAEVMLAEIGVQRASDSDLKKLSQEMIDDHNKMNQELMTLASQKRIAVPRAVDFRAQFCVQCLNGLARDDFDRCYAKAQHNAHEEALASFEAEAERGQDPEIKAFANRAVPRIKEHLHKLKEICEKHEKEHKGGSEKAASSERRER
jgi:putative membrane protein